MTGIIIGVMSLVIVCAIILGWSIYKILWRDCF